MLPQPPQAPFRPNVNLLDQARRTWFPRFLGAGADYNDVQATLARILRWQDWCREWSATGDAFAELAEEGERADHRASAVDWWLAASLAYQFGQFVFFTDLDEKLEAHARHVKSYARAARLLDPPAERVGVPSPLGSLPAYLHTPRVAGPHPVALLVPGLDSTKEQLNGYARAFVARDVVALAIEGPGQGEAHPLGPLPTDYAPVMRATMDWIASRADLDERRVGALGTSFGGHLAVSGAGAVDGLRAVVDLSGPFDLADLEQWPVLTHQSLLHAAHATSHDALPHYSLAERAPRVQAALLVAHGEEDRVIPVVHADRIARAATGAPSLDVWRVPGAGHTLQNVHTRWRPRLADWLVDRLH